MGQTPLFGRAGRGRPACHLLFRQRDLAGKSVCFYFSLQAFSGHAGKVGGCHSWSGEEEVGGGGRSRGFWDVSRFEGEIDRKFCSR